MIYILDDSVTEQRKKEIQYLQNTPYSEVCVLIEKPTKKINREILATFSDDQNCLLCIHRSLKYFNDFGSELAESEAIRNNMIEQVKQMNISCMVFGRDMSRNREKLFIDKDVFYRNLKLFLDTMIAGGDVELDILYDGAFYRIAERKRLLNEIVDIINMECPPYNNPLLSDLLFQYFGEDPDKVLELWANKGFSRKEIRQYINDNL